MERRSEEDGMSWTKQHLGEPTIDENPPAPGQITELVMTGATSGPRDLHLK